MKDTRLINYLSLANFLSYGAEGVSMFPLTALNVLIGPNASGKSNLIEAIGILQAAPRDLQAPLRQSGFAQEWISQYAEASNSAGISAVVSLPEFSSPFYYTITLSPKGQEMEVVAELLQEPEGGDVAFENAFFKHCGSEGVLRRVTDPNKSAASEVGAERTNEIEKLNPKQSVLSQRKDPKSYPEIFHLAEALGKIAIYTEWSFGRRSKMRLPQRTDLITDFLAEDGSNLGLIWNQLQHNREAKEKAVTAFRKLYSEAEDVTPKVEAGTIQVFIYEKGLPNPIRATRLSDGTLRYLCLITILCHPDPPPLICIEEPELGLHPDIVRTIAALLVDASTRTQLIVTTHSDVLVSALSDHPESIVVCEREKSGTTLRRLDLERMKEWLEKYSLGELWSMGEIGGNRW